MSQRGRLSRRWMLINGRLLQDHSKINLWVSPDVLRIVEFHRTWQHRLCDTHRASYPPFGFAFATNSAANQLLYGKGASRLRAHVLYFPNLLFHPVLPVRATAHALDLSFPTIAGENSNGAIIHYSATPGSCHTVGPESMLLLDSGAQYEDGTTDVTRTMHFGEPTAEQKEVRDETSNLPACCLSFLRLLSTTYEARSRSIVSVVVAIWVVKVLRNTWLRLPFE